MTKPKLSRRAKNLALAAVAGLAGFVSVAITFTALLVGLALDARYEQRGTYTIILLTLSVPLSLVAMLMITLGAVRRIIPQPPQRHKQQHTTHEEEYVE